MLRGSSKFVGVVILGGILFGSLGLNLYNNDFPLGYHADESKKVSFIKKGTYDFNHPLLMLQAVRLANIFFDFSNKQAVVELGRDIMAVFGVLIVLVSYHLVCQINRKYALITSLAVAVSPIMVIHAHYLKEDIIVTFFILLSLLLFIKYIEKPSMSSVFYLGLVAGAALSSKYTSVLLFVLFLIMPIFISRLRRLPYFVNMFFCAVIAAGVFLIVNYPMFLDFSEFIKGFNFEWRHVVTGHTLKFYPHHFFFGFHLLYSIVPGVTMIVALFAGFGVIERLMAWKAVEWKGRILVVYMLLFYFVHEVSPTKPPPGFMRYMLPIVPVLIYFSLTSVERVSRFVFNKRSSSAFIMFSLLMLSIPFYETLRLDYYLNKDTRGMVEELNKHESGKVLFGGHTGDWSGKVGFYNYEEIGAMQREGVTKIVVSSFEYDRYLLGGTLNRQDSKVYRISRKYAELFQYPYGEIKPGYKSFAFSNPTIRIVDISGDVLEKQ